jgi:hypothetical protein
VKLKLDENLGRSARDELAGGGHEVATVPGAIARQALAATILSAVPIGQATIAS